MNCTDLKQAIIEKQSKAFWSAVHTARAVKDKQFSADFLVQRVLEMCDEIEQFINKNDEGDVPTCPHCRQQIFTGFVRVCPICHQPKE